MTYFLSTDIFNWPVYISPSRWLLNKGYIFHKETIFLSFLWWNHGKMPILSLHTWFQIAALWNMPFRFMSQQNLQIIVGYKSLCFFPNCQKQQVPIGFIYILSACSSGSQSVVCGSLEVPVCLPEGLQSQIYSHNNTMKLCAFFTLSTFAFMVQKQWWIKLLGSIAQIKAIALNHNAIIFFISTHPQFSVFVFV